MHFFIFSFAHFCLFRFQVSYDCDRRLACKLQTQYDGCCVLTTQIRAICVCSVYVLIHLYFEDLPYLFNLLTNKIAYLIWFIWNSNEINNYRAQIDGQTQKKIIFLFSLKCGSFSFSTIFVQSKCIALTLSSLFTIAAQIHCALTHDMDEFLR